MKIRNIVKVITNIFGYLIRVMKQLRKEGLNVMKYSFSEFILVGV